MIRLDFLFSPLISKHLHVQNKTSDGIKIVHCFPPLCGPSLKSPTDWEVTLRNSVLCEVGLHGLRATYEVWNKRRHIDRLHWTKLLQHERSNNSSSRPTYVKMWRERWWTTVVKSRRKSLGRQEGSGKIREELWIINSNETWRVD